MTGGAGTKLTDRGSSGATALLPFAAVSLKVPEFPVPTLSSEAKILCDMILVKVRNTPVLGQAEFVADIKKTIDAHSIPTECVLHAYRRALTVMAPEAFASTAAGTRALSAFREMRNFPGNRVTVNQRFSIPQISEDLWCAALADGLDLGKTDQPFELSHGRFAWNLEIENTWQAIFNQVCFHRRSIAPRLEDQEKARNRLVPLEQLRAVIRQDKAIQDTRRALKDERQNEIHRIIDRRLPHDIETLTERMNSLARTPAMSNCTGEVSGFAERVCLHAARAYIGFLTKTAINVSTKDPRPEYLVDACLIAEDYVARKSSQI